MRCRAAHKLVVRALDGDLPGEGESRLGDHLSQCPECARRQRDLLAARDALLSLRTETIRSPQGLDARIKASAREALAEAKIRQPVASPPLGSPAFVATCASLLVSAVMLYAITTQVYVRSLAAQSGRSLAVTPARLASAGRAEEPASGPAALAAELARPPAWAEMRPAVYAPGSSARPDADAVPARAKRSKAVATVKVGVAPAADDPAPVERDAAPGPAADSPEMVLASLPQPESTSSTDSVSASADATPDSAASVEDGSAPDLMAGLVAEYVVAKYVVGKLASPGAAPSMVTTSMPPATASPAEDETGN